MENVNKSFDVNKVFAGVEKSLEKYDSVSSGKGKLSEKGKAWEALSAEVVSGLTDILKNVLSTFFITNIGNIDIFFTEQIYFFFCTIKAS